MTQESPRVELMFSYQRFGDDTYEGEVAVVEPETSARSLSRPPLWEALRQEDWVRFVVDTIRQHPKVSAVGFVFPGKPKVHYMDRRTIEQIQSGALTAKDLTLGVGK